MKKINEKNKWKFQILSLQYTLWKRSRKIPTVLTLNLKYIFSEGFSKAMIFLTVCPFRSALNFEHSLQNIMSKWRCNVESDIIAGRITVLAKKIDSHWNLLHSFCHHYRYTVIETLKALGFNKGGLGLVHQSCYPELWTELFQSLHI